MGTCRSLLGGRCLFFVCDLCCLPRAACDLFLVALVGPIILLGILLEEQVIGCG